MFIVKYLKDYTNVKTVWRSCQIFCNTRKKIPHTNIKPKENFVQILILSLAIWKHLSPMEQQQKNKELQHFACIGDRQLDDIVEGAQGNCILGLRNFIKFLQTF